MTEHTFSEQGNVWSVLESHQKQIDAACREIETVKKINAQILDHLGLVVGDYYRIHKKPEPKGTIKGGWVNVSSVSCGPHFSRLYQSKEEAARYRDPRDISIACIQIPDFQEGGGL